MALPSRSERPNGATSARCPHVRWLVPALIGACCAGVLGCGESSIGRTPPSAPTASAGAHAPAPRAPHGVTARIDVSSDKVLAEGKVRIAAGAPSDTEVKREIEAARKAGIPLPSGESAASFENSPSSSPTASIAIPVVSWNPRSKPIATWIIPILEWAVAHGWAGSVTSGYRTLYEQSQLNAAGAFSAPAGLSNHETSVYPGGAVDVTQPGQLIAVLRGYGGPVKLIGGVLGPLDPEHFSATGD